MRIMSSSFRAQAKRLIVIGAVGICLAFAIQYGVPKLNSQRRHLRAVEVHIVRIKPLWESFRTSHLEFEDVSLFAYTGGDGMLGVSGFVPFDEDVVRLREFLEGTVPPRPVYLKGVRVAGAEWLDYLKTVHVKKSVEPGNPTNGSQPIRSQTNQAGSADAVRP